MSGRMKLTGQLLLLFIAGPGLLVGHEGQAQPAQPAPQQSGDAATGRGPQAGGGGPQFKNLQVLPKDISMPQLFGLMRSYSAALGVQCNYCHAVDPQTRRPNFASDAKPEKGVARTMISMTREINQRYLANLPDLDHGATHGQAGQTTAGAEHASSAAGNEKAGADAGSEQRVGCGTCHRGHAHPEPFQAAAEEKPGPPPATPR